MFKNTKALIFDLDDTLIDDKIYRINCVKKIINYCLLKKYRSIKISTNVFDKKKLLKNIYKKNYITNF